MTSNIATFDVDSPSDVVVDVVAPSGVTITNLLVNGEVITKSGKWSSAGGKLTLKADYLSQLAEDTAFTVSFSDNHAEQFTVHIV